MSARKRIAGNKLRHTLIDMPSCPICYEETSNPHFCVPCRHIFCYKCISAWKNRTCPLCRGNIASYRPIKLASFIENDFSNYAEKSKLFSTVLVILFLLVDLQSPSGFVRCVVYPPCRDICLAIWEIIYILALIIFMPVKCIYRSVVEIVIYELYDILISICYTPVNIGKYLLYLPLFFYEGVKLYFLENSWTGILPIIVHIVFIILFLDSASQTDLLRMFEKIQIKRRLRDNIRHIIKYFKEKDA